MPRGIPPISQILISMINYSKYWWFSRSFWLSSSNRIFNITGEENLYEQSLDARVHTCTSLLNISYYAWCRAPMYIYKQNMHHHNDWQSAMSRARTSNESSMTSMLHLIQITSVVTSLQSARLYKNTLERSWIPANKMHTMNFSKLSIISTNQGLICMKLNPELMHPFRALNLSFKNVIVDATSANVKGHNPVL